MIEWIIRAAFKRSGLTLLIALVTAAMGTLAFGELRRDVFPDLTAPLFNVIVQNAAMSTEELEAQVAVPLEAALAGLPGTERIRSTSQQGVVQITVEFDPEHDHTRARQLVAERMAAVAPELPAGTGAPLLSSLTGRLNEIIELTVEADPGSVDLMTLRDLAELDIAVRLLAVPGVAAVERLGGYLRQFQVQLDPDRMLARGVTLSEVMHALEGASLNGSGGVLVQGPMQWNVRAIGKTTVAADIGAVVVSLRGDTPVLVADVADVREAPAPRRGIAHRLEGEIVSCRVVKQFGADTLQVSGGVRRALEGLGGSLPSGVHVRVAYDQADLVRASLLGVGRAVLVGAMLVVVVLFLFLGQLRPALIVTLTIPLSVAAGALLLRAAGIGLNTMTLGGLAIAVGLVVDASIIVVENVVHSRAPSGASTRAAPGAAGAEIASASTLGAALAVGRPIAFATLVVCAVFLPPLFMGGLEGRMYRPLAAAVVFSLVAALALALTLTPAACHVLLRNVRAMDDRLGPLRRVYERGLAWCLRHAGVVRLGSLALTLPALVLALGLGSDFMPALDEGALLLQTTLPREASLEQVDLLNHRIEDVLRTFPEVEDVVRRTGRSERTEDPMPHTVSDVLVVLRPERQRSLDELSQAMRAQLSRVPGVSVLLTTPLGMRIDEGLGGSPADLSVRIYGPDLSELDRLMVQARELAERVSGLEDLRAEQTGGLPELRIELDREALARVGLTPGDVVRAIEVGLVGVRLGEIQRGQRRFDLVLRLQPGQSGTPEGLRGLWVDGHDGTRVPLSQVARIEPSVGPDVIRREAGSRRLSLDASVVGRDLAGAAKELEHLLKTELPLPTGYFFAIGGRVESQARSSRALLVAVLCALFGVVVLLSLALGSVADALVIVATLPDAFVGGVLALWLAGESWNVSSLVGLMGLLGIAVQNGLVLVTQTRALLAQGLPFEVALRQACVGRLRPKLMTAATAILGLLPLLMAHFEGTELERPLAIVMVGGLLTSTAFTLLALPTFYALVHQLRLRGFGRQGRVGMQS